MKSFKEFRISEDAPTNAVGDGSNVAMPPSHEPGVHVKKKKKENKLKIKELAKLIPNNHN